MNINVSLVFKTSLFLGISDYIRWPLVSPAETLSQASSQLRCDCNFPLLCLHYNIPHPFPDRGTCTRNSMLASAVLSSCDSHPSHLESHFQKPFWLTYFLIDSWLPHIRWHCGRRGCRRFAAVCNKVGARGGGSAVRGVPCRYLVGIAKH